MRVQYPPAAALDPSVQHVAYYPISIAPALSQLAQIFKAAGSDVHTPHLTSRPGLDRIVRGRLGPRACVVDLQVIRFNRAKTGSIQAKPRSSFSEILWLCITHLLCLPLGAYYSFRNAVSLHTATVLCAKANTAGKKKCPLLFFHSQPTAVRKSTLSRRPSFVKVPEQATSDPNSWVRVRTSTKRRVSSGRCLPPRGTFGAALGTFESGPSPRLGSPMDSLPSPRPLLFSM
jgi:hypothetical protein